MKLKNMVHNNFFQKIVLPATIALLLFVITVFAFILPAFERNAVNQKKIMLQELTSTAWSILHKYYTESSSGAIDATTAQQLAMADIEALRYGTNKKDYFWITDMEPRMLMHPYIHELTGTNLQDYSDPDGKKLFIEAVEIAKNHGEGFINYKWQFMDDTSRIVPKLSYVKKFEPWQWIIGTGIYLDDVQTEIAKLRNQLLLILLLSSVLIALLIVFMTWQSLLLDNKRLEAEEQLRISQERYRAMVEASTEGALLVLQNYMYANKTLIGMLGYNDDEIADLGLWDVFPDTGLNNEFSDFESLYAAENLPTNLETTLLQKNKQRTKVLVNMSRISVAGNKALVVLVREIQRAGLPDSDAVPLQADSMNLWEFGNFGFFRSSFSRNSRFTEATQSAMRILGFKSKDEMLKTRIDDLFADATELRTTTAQILKYGFINNKVLRLSRKTGQPGYVAVWLILRKTADGERFCEGFVQDVDAQFRQEADNKALLAAAYNKNAVFLRPVSAYTAYAPVCTPQTPVYEAAAAMNLSDSQYIVVRNNAGQCLGVLSDTVIRKNIEAMANSAVLVNDVVTANNFTCNVNQTVFEVLWFMHTSKLKVLPVVDGLGKIHGVFSESQLVPILNENGNWILQSIDAADSLDDLGNLQYRLALVARAMSESGIHARHISALISTASDAVIKKIGDTITAELGPAPVPFAFLVFGSVGRNEQSLATDQDNALVYADTDSNEASETAARYFELFASRMTESLVRCGYAACIGNYMASNVQWCRPLQVFKSYFDNWIKNPVPQHLLETEVLFDFRYAYGNFDIAVELKNYMLRCMHRSDPFFYQMAANTTSIRLQSTGNEVVDIKKLMLPLVNIVRLYSLKAQLPENNTFVRIAALRDIEILNSADADALSKTYDLLLKLRINNQLRQIFNTYAPDNKIEVAYLTEVELQQLKLSISTIQSFYTRLNFDFKHNIG